MAVCVVGKARAVLAGVGWLLSCAHRGLPQLEIALKVLECELEPLRFG